MGRARTWSYLRRHAIPPGWWNVFHGHATRVWEIDPAASFFIVDDWGGLRVSTHSYGDRRGELRYADHDVFCAAKMTCPCCGARFRDEFAYSPRRDLCPNCCTRTYDEQNEMEFATARKWFLEEDA